jgi:hypothetical protein
VLHLVLLVLQETFAVIPLSKFNAILVRFVNHLHLLKYYLVQLGITVHTLTHLLLCNVLQVLTLWKAHRHARFAL